MNLKLGMYVKTNLGNIGKIVEEYTYKNGKVAYPEPQEWILDNDYILNESIMYCEGEKIITIGYNLIDVK